MVKRSEVNLLEWIGKLVSLTGVLALLAYASGYLKLFFIYNSLGCIWALGFHSFQEIAIAGVANILLTSLVAVPLFLSFSNSIDTDNRGRRIVGLLSVGLFASVIFAIWWGVSINYLVMDLMFSFCWYGVGGTVFAVFARSSIEENTYNYVPMLIAFFLAISLFSSLQTYGRESFSSLNKMGRFHYVESDAGEKGYLIGAVSGRYLIRGCGAEGSYRIIGSTDKWSVSSEAFEGCD